jgi:hypothetical protein
MLAHQHQQFSACQLLTVQSRLRWAIDRGFDVLVGRVKPTILSTGDLLHQRLLKTVFSGCFPQGVVLQRTTTPWDLKIVCIQTIACYIYEYGKF